MSHRWGMVIDLDSCTGCEACVVACHAENNIATVGPEEAARGRAKHWLRVERYWEGEFPDVRLKFRPVLCQQCDAAPCEPVCPTYASHHTDEGLNAQVYNRCIGTRYCANACSYNVRFFNFFHPIWEKPLHLQLNPDVSVREVGVMEKCTFCVQRIKATTQQVKAENRELKDCAHAGFSSPSFISRFSDLASCVVALIRCTQNVHFSITPTSRTETSGFSCSCSGLGHCGLKKSKKRTLYGQAFAQ